MEKTMSTPPAAPATRTVSGTSVRGRRRASEFRLPDGRKILVALPEEARALRAKLAAANNSGSGASNGTGGPAGAGAEAEARDGSQIEVVVHGSAEHQQLLREAQRHHAEQHAALRARYGTDFDEWARTAAELDSVTAQLERLADHSSQLNANFSKFGFDAQLRTYDGGDDDGGGSGSRSGSGSGAASTYRGEGGGDGEDNRIGWSQKGRAEPLKLFRRPVVKQYFHRGLLWRASEETEVMCFELFFDLLYVGIIAVIGDHASEDATGEGFLRFAIVFLMSWKIWTDVTTLISWFETNDIFQRVEILFLIACLLGLTTNMLQIFDDQYDTWTQMVSFYLASRLFMAAHCLVITVQLPMVKGMMIANIVVVLAGAALWVGSVHAAMPGRLGLVFPALLTDMFGGSVVVGLFRYSRSHSTALARRFGRWFEFYPAVNIEHKVERTNAFVTLVLGYSVVGVIYQNAGFGVNAFLGKAVLGLVQAFVFNWLYFEVDGASLHMHAIRRHVNAAIAWQHAHLVFIFAFILSSAALPRLVLAADCPDAPAGTLTDAYRQKSEADVPLGLRLFYSTGLGVSLLAMGVIAASHEHKLPADCRLPKWARLANRAAAAVVMCVLPAAAARLDSLDLISVTTALSVWVLVVELWGISCKGDSYFGGGGQGSGQGGDGCRYTARCSKRELEDAVRADGEVDIMELGKAEKTAVPDF